MIDKSSIVPFYIQLEKALREKISNELGPEEPLGTIDEIAKTYDVSAITVKHSLHRLMEAGIVRSVKSKGYFVLKVPEEPKGAKIVAFSAFRGERSILNPMYVRLFEGADSILRKHGIALNLYSQEEIMSDSLRQSSDFLGFIIVGLRNRVLHDSLFASNARFVLADISSNVYPSVLTDNKLGARIAVEHLLKLGHKDIAIVNGNLEDETFAARSQGYMEVLRENRIKIRKNFILEDFRIPPNEKTEAMKNMLFSACPSAIFFSSDPHANCYIPKILNMGISIPDDLSVTGYDDMEGSFYMEPPLTTVKQPMFEVGRKVAEMLLAPSAQSPTHPLLIPPELIIRESCKAVKK